MIKEVESQIVFSQILKLILYAFFGDPRDIGCVTLGNTKGQECGRPIFFVVTTNIIFPQLYIPPPNLYLGLLE